MDPVNYQSGFTPIDTSSIKNQSYHDPMAHNTAFDSILGKIGAGLSMMGPTLDAGLRFGGFNQGAAITSAAIMGFAGQGGMMTPGMSPMSGGVPMGGGVSMGGGPKFNSIGGNMGTSSPKHLGGGIPLGDAPGYPGAGGSGMPGGAPGFPGGSTAGMPGAMGGVQDVSGFDSQINSMMNNNMVFLALQTKVQNVSQMTQMTSNIAKTDSDAKLNAIRNMRA